MVDPDAEKDGDEYLTVTFSANPDIWLAAADESYKGKLPFVYNGQNDDLAATCPKPLDVSEDGYCDLIGVLQFKRRFACSRSSKKVAECG